MHVLRQALRLVALALVAAAVLALLVAPAGAAAPALERGVVDITTRLGLQDGAAAGTGMVLSADGWILTNNHVIRGATTVRVTVPSSRRTYPATVVGYSVTNDVAVLRLKGASGLATISAGNSGTVRVGDAVTAVGNAGGVGGAPSSSTGKITALNRSIVASDGQGSSERLTGLFVTDAELQPGDSGGPLLNAAGEVIAMNTAASRGFEFRGGSSVGMAIPIAHALALAKQIEAGRKSATVHVGPTAFLGVNVTSSDGFSGQNGAVVIAVVPSSPAARAGLEAGSVITGLNGKAVVTYHTLTGLLLQTSPGSPTRIAWLDPDGVRHTATVHTAVGPPQ